ncbi:MAG: DUF4249 domain-containing protein [Bacteroidetes bacterium]|nr:DUF4249 domain-containing protein [Bacteroidota bacterium]
MKYKSVDKIWRMVLASLSLYMSFGCTEEVSFETSSLESALVIEAVITNEVKNHEIMLSRTYAFELDGPQPETNARVFIESNDGTIEFTESSSGRYRATRPFSAQENINYQLVVLTSNGDRYSSSPVAMTKTTPIGRLYAERVVGELNEDGVTIFVDSFDPEGESQFYRFEYEEAYKVIAPKWRAEDLVVTNPNWPACAVALIPKSEEQRVCFAKDTSTAIIIGNTMALSEDRLVRFPVRRIRDDNYIMSHRYSILVRQYIQTREAHTYFETLKEFSGEGSLFSQSQPGFFEGNIFSESNANEKVLGFFEASFVSEERLFFNYEDFFSGEELPDYVASCFEFTPVRDQGHPTDRCGSLIGGLLNEEIMYWDVNPKPESTQQGPFIVVPRICGDCRVLGSNEIPEFWTE